MATHALSDEQVDQELKKMIAFIKQEAVEKAREVHIKGDEEFAIEKARIVRQETDAIDARHEQRIKAISVQQQVVLSQVSSRSRLRVLAAREAVLDGIFEEARRLLPEASRIAGMSLETGLYALEEEAVTVRVGAGESAVVSKAAERAMNEYQLATGNRVRVHVGEQLGEESCGGVVLSGLGGKVEIGNSLGERLSVLEGTALPSIRAALWGEVV